MPDCCYLTDDAYLHLALEVLKIPLAPGTLRDQAAAVLSAHLAAVLAPPEPAADPTPADDTAPGESAGVEAVFNPAEFAAAPADLTTVGGADADAHVFNGPVLRRVREARARAKAQLVAGGMSPAEAEKKVGAVGAGLILSLLLKFGPDIMRIVQAIIAAIKGG